MYMLCFYQQMIVDYIKNLKGQVNSHLLSSIQSNCINVRRLHVQSSSQQMMIDYQEEQKRSKLQCNVSN